MSLYIHTLYLKTSGSTDGTFEVLPVASLPGQRMSGQSVSQDG